MKWASRFFARESEDRIPGGGLRLGQRPRQGRAITDEVRPGIFGDRVHCGVEPIRASVNRGIDNPRQRHRRRIDELTLRQPFVRQRPCRRQARQHQMISPRRLGRAAVETQDESSIALLHRHFLVKAPGQGFVQIAPCHGDGIGRLGRPGEGFVETCLGQGFFQRRFPFRAYRRKRPVHCQTAGRHLPLYYFIAFSFRIQAREPNPA